ncbi:MAG: ABC transporter permease [Thermoleophilaceae bacterium]|nr:ABC transporter permease [Thermoleophilaceae bacterium]
MLRYRFLFEQMVRRELRQKYKGSALGVLWYLVNPLVLMAAYALVFSVLLKVADQPQYPLFLLVGLIVWVFFSQALLSAAPSLVQNAPLVRKVSFPREAIPASVATVQLATFLVMLAVVAPLALILRGTLDPALLLLPVIVALLFCLVLGLSLAVSVLHAHFRDVEPVLATALLPWFFLTPIFLPVDSMPGIAEHAWVGDVLRWGNPVAPFIEATRDILYSGVAPSGAALAYVSVAGIGALGLGVLLFRRLERDLAVVL